MNGICFDFEKETSKSQRVSELYEKTHKEAERSLKKLELREF
jgi:hypothetical protein